VVTLFSFFPKHRIGNPKPTFPKHWVKASRNISVKSGVLVSQVSSRYGTAFRAELFRVVRATVNWLLALLTWNNTSALFRFVAALPRTEVLTYRRKC
jgi:hypothetical protein